MRAYLIINAVDLSPWVRSIQHTPVYRQSREVITMDGVKHRRQIEKRSLRVSLRDMTDADLAVLHAALTPLASVDYLASDGTEAESVRFWVSGPTATGKLVKGTTTYYGDVSLELEER